MTQENKRQPMENLRAELSKVESPSWHKDALKKTEEQFAMEGEQPVDWEEAKKDLRKKTNSRRRL